MQLETTHGLFLSKTASVGADLQKEMHRIGARFGVEARPSLQDVGLVEVIFYDDAGQRTAVGANSSEALHKVWPSDAPPLATPPTLPHRALLQAACHKDSINVEALAETALVPLLFHSVPINRPDAANNFLWRWARATALFTQGDYKQSLQDFQSVLESLKNNHFGPIWRKLPTTSSTTPSAITLGKKGLYAFEEGTLAYSEFRNGHARWDRALGRIDAAPNLFDGEDPILTVSDDGVKALSAETGELLWEVEIPGAHPEIAVQDRLFVISGSQEIRAVNRTTGQYIWSQELSEQAVAGPVVIDKHLAVPVGTGIRTFNIRSGEPLRNISTGDEVSSPLLTTPKGLLWLLVGSDEVIQLSPKTGKTLVRFHDLPGVIWPPLVLKERLVITTQNSRRKHLQLQILDTQRAKRRRHIPTHSLVQARSGGTGLIHLSRKGQEIIGRDPRLRLRTRYALPSTGTALATYGSYAAVGLEDGLVMVDLRKQRSKGTHYRLEAPVTEVVMGAAGTAALLSNGAVYGWFPEDDPRRDTWLHMIREMAAEAAYLSGQYRVAQRIAQDNLRQAPADWKALETLALALKAQSPTSSLSSFLELYERLPSGSLPKEQTQIILSTLGLSVVPTSTGSASTFVRTSSTAQTVETSSSAVPSPSKPKDNTYISGGFKVIDEIITKDRRISVGAHRLTAYDAKTSSIRWRKRFSKEKVLLATTYGDHLLVWTQKKLRRIRLTNGRIMKRLHFSRALQHVAHLTEAPLALVNDGQKLSLVDASTAERLRSIPLPGILALQAQDNRIVMKLSNESTWEVNLPILQRLTK